MPLLPVFFSLLCLLAPTVLAQTFQATPATALNLRPSPSMAYPDTPAPWPAATPAAASAAIAPQQSVAQPPQSFDYRANIDSDVFGAHLFTGAFARAGATQFNPDYAIAIGDQIQVRLWGAFVFDATLVVDPKGNVFLPHVGPVKVLGVRNQDLQRAVEAAVGRAFRANVHSYASLAAAQPVLLVVAAGTRRLTPPQAGWLGLGCGLLIDLVSTRPLGPGGIAAAAAGALGAFVVARLELTGPLFWVTSSLLVAAVFESLWLVTMVTLGAVPSHGGLGALAVVATAGLGGLAIAVGERTWRWWASPVRRRRRQLRRR